MWSAESNWRAKPLCNTDGFERSQVKLHLPAQRSLDRLKSFEEQSRPFAELFINYEKPLLVYLVHSLIPIRLSLQTQVLEGIAVP